MAIYDLGGNIIQSAFGVEGNALSQAYDINGNALMSNIVFDDSTTVTNVYTSTINAYPQGGCMDDDGNLCACLLTTSQFIKHNIATGNDVLYSFTPDAYGHGNGMAYNPNNEKTTTNRLPTIISFLVNNRRSGMERFIIPTNRTKHTASTN